MVRTSAASLVQLACGRLPNADIVFSWNALLGIGGAAVADTVRQIGECLSDGGTAVMHHGDYIAEVAMAARESGLYVAVQERVDWPTGAANCWITTLVTHPVETRVVWHSTLRDEMRCASALMSAIGLPAAGTPGTQEPDM